MSVAPSQRQPRRCLFFGRCAAQHIVLDRIYTVYELILVSLKLAVWIEASALTFMLQSRKMFARQAVTPE